MTKQEFVQWAVKNGWTLDRWGHLQKQLYGPSKPDDAGRHHVQLKEFRFKLSRIAARYEVRCSAGWVRLSSGYFSKLEITPDGELKGMAR